MSNRAEAMLQDWRQKSAYLQAHYAMEAPIAFYDAVGLTDLPEDAQICVMRSEAPQGQRFQRYTNVDDLLCESAIRRDAYVYPATYFNSYAKESLLRSLSCVYIDLDHVCASDLVRLCREDFFGHRPTYLVNSGSGVHLVYVLSEMVYAYNWAKFLLRRVHRGLLEVFKARGYDADLGTGLSHAYRVVGSRTKIGQVCTAYRVGLDVGISALSASVGVCWQRPMSKASRSMCRIPDDAPHVQNGFYAYLVKEIPARTKEGHRYTSLFALACVGHKCGIAVSKIREDVQMVAHRLELPLREAEHAVEACDAKKARSVRASTLEAWLGWCFEHATKRNGRTRAEHLAWVAKNRAEKSRNRVMAFLRAYPNMTISAMAERLHMARRTVAKYVHEAAETVQRKVQNTLQDAADTAKTVAETFIAYIPALLGELASGGSLLMGEFRYSGRLLSLWWRGSDP